MWLIVYPIVAIRWGNISSIYIIIFTCIYVCRYWLLLNGYWFPVDCLLIVVCRVPIDCDLFVWEHSFTQVTAFESLHVRSMRVNPSCQVLRDEPFVSLYALFWCMKAPINDGKRKKLFHVCFLFCGGMEVGGRANYIANHAAYSLTEWPSLHCWPVPHKCLHEPRRSSCARIGLLTVHGASWT